jgi:hypothetical protein
MLRVSESHVMNPDAERYHQQAVLERNLALKYCERSIATVHETLAERYQAATDAAILKPIIVDRD